MTTNIMLDVFAVKHSPSSSNGKDAGLSIRWSEFESPWGRWYEMCWSCEASDVLVVRRRRGRWRRCHRHHRSIRFDSGCRLSMTVDFPFKESDLGVAGSSPAMLKACSSLGRAPGYHRHVKWNGPGLARSEPHKAMYHITV